ncbi:MAG TPA: GNAT family N-acetyltransferase [Natronosporangium sp.]
MGHSSRFPPAVTDYWHARFHAGTVAHREAGLTVTIDAGLPDDRRAMLLRTAAGELSAVLRPELADQLDLRSGDRSEAGLHQRLAEAGIELHGADYLFYFPSAEADAVRREPAQPAVRQLTSDDAGAFAGFAAAAPEPDREDAFVELDHWVVFGSFDQDRLVCAASMYPWDGPRLADLGVLTLPGFRGRGHARRVVRAISRHAYRRGCEPQYRCQLDNQASVALAKSAGLALFGTWDVASSAAD